MMMMTELMIDVAFAVSGGGIIPRNRGADLNQPPKNLCEQAQNEDTRIPRQHAELAIAGSTHSATIAPQAILVTLPNDL